MITKIECLAHYRQAEKEYCILYEDTLGMNTPWEKQLVMNYLLRIMSEWAYTHAEEIWPTK